MVAALAYKLGANNQLLHSKNCSIAKDVKVLKMGFFNTPVVAIQKSVGNKKC